jgi:hypothetical protein
MITIIKSVTTLAGEWMRRGGHFRPPHTCGAQIGREVPVCSSTGSAGIRLKRAVWLPLSPLMAQE